MKERRGMTAWAQYALFRIVSALLNLFPINLNLKTARLLSRGWRLLMPRHRERAIRHLEMAMGNALTPEQRARIADECLAHWTMFAVELLCAPRLISRATWHHYLTPRDLHEPLRMALSGRGAIIITGHYGNWELLGHLIACFGLPIAAVMRPLDNVYLNDYLVRNRATHGLKLLNKSGATAQAEALLRQGYLVGFIADQDAGRKGLFVNFFGRPASTYKSIGLLAMHTRVPIIVGYARRTGSTFHYEVVAKRIIHPEEWESQPDPLRWITQTYTEQIEIIARCDPTQYLWIHRRWKSQRPASTAPSQSSVAENS